MRNPGNNKMQRIILLICIACLVAWLYCSLISDSGSFVRTVENTTTLAENVPFTLKKGDILIRPNWGFLPGSCSMEHGRRSGHVAVVTEEAKGKDVQEALEKATVVEALFWDQGTHKFLFNKRDQIREGKAIVSFGNRFKGMRYRLRLNITVSQADILVQFLRNQLDGGYNIFSLKKYFSSYPEKAQALSQLKAANWNCATLTWETFYLVTGVDIDANQGLLIFPNDIIACRSFDLPEGRILF
jgi:hypothetical protein